jgi:predicted nucleic acid-binding protein
MFPPWEERLMVVADASVLIAFAKLRRLELLRLLYGEVLMGAVVKMETLDQGRAVAAPGVEELQRALEEGWLRVVRLSARERRFMQSLLRSTRLDEGEAEALAVAHSREWLVVVDDKEARAVAGAMRLSYLGSAGVLLEALAQGHLTLETLEEAVRDLTRVIWLSPAVVTEVLRRARELRI